MLFDTNLTDPLTMTAVAGAVAAVALLATAGSARRATRSEPMETLRVE